LNYETLPHFSNKFSPIPKPPLTGQKFKFV
jgi:hypothetical protein